MDPKDFRRRQLYARPKNRAKVRKIRETFRQIADAHDGTMANAVIAWELMHPALTGAIIGVRNPNEARETIGGDWKLTQTEVSAVQNALEAGEKIEGPAS